MRKLTLDPETLVVQSFPTEEVDVRRGTVRGMDSATVDQDTRNTCDRCTDVDTCPAGTCAASCLASCASCPLSCNPADCPSANGRC